MAESVTPLAEALRKLERTTASISANMDRAVTAVLGTAMVLG